MPSSIYSTMQEADSSGNNGKKILVSKVVCLREEQFLTLRLCSKYKTIYENQKSRKQEKTREKISKINIFSEIQTFFILAEYVYWN